jgi:hypothetical protein
VLSTHETNFVQPAEVTAMTTATAKARAAMCGSIAAPTRISHAHNPAKIHGSVLEHGREFG